MLSLSRVSNWREDALKTKPPGSMCEGRLKSNMRPVKAKYCIIDRRVTSFQCRKLIRNLEPSPHNFAILTRYLMFHIKTKYSNNHLVRIRKYDNILSKGIPMSVVSFWKLYHSLINLCTIRKILNRIINRNGCSEFTYSGRSSQSSANHRLYVLKWIC